MIQHTLQIALALLAASGKQELSHSDRDLRDLAYAADRRQADATARLDASLSRRQRRKRRRLSTAARGQGGEA